MNSEIYNNTLDTLLKYPDYGKRLAQLVQEKNALSSESRELKSQKIINTIWQENSPKIVLNSENVIFKNLVYEQIKKISLDNSSHW